MGKTKVNEKGVPYGARQKVPFWFNLAWTTRGISAGLNAVLMMNLTFFCTDILGLKATTVGLMFVGSKVIDALTDLVAGVIIDKTHSRLGKARPYEIFIIFEWMFTILMFNSSGFSETGKYIWIFIMYVLINAVCSTMLGAADSVYLSRVFTTQKNQIGVMSFNGACVYIISIAFNIIFPQFLAGAGTTAAGWSQLVITLGIPLAIIGILRFLFCKEVVTDTADTKSPEKKSDHSTKEMFGALLKNKYAFIVIGLMFLTFVVNNMSAATTYYFKYIVGDIGLQSLIGMTGLVSPIILMIFPILSRKLGTTKILQYFMIVGIIGYVIRTIGGTAMPTLLIGSLLSGIATVPISVMINTYLIDCMDYGEWKTGIRVEGLIASTSNFASKLGSALASGLVGFVMGLAGYDGTLAVQSASANNAIIALFNIVPIILFAIMIVLAFMYRVDDIRDQMNKDLAERHQA